MAVWCRMVVISFLMFVEMSTGQNNDAIMKHLKRMESELGKVTKRVSELEVKDKEQTEKIRRLEERLVTCEAQNSDIRIRDKENQDATRPHKENIEELGVTGDHIISNGTGSERHNGPWQTNSLNKDWKYLWTPISTFASVKERQRIKAGNPSMEDIRPLLRGGRQSGIADEGVAFSATVSPHDYGPLGKNQVMIFDRVLTNIGNAYHAHSGIFTAPVHGVYFVSVTVSGWVHTMGHSYLHVMQSGNSLCSIWAARGDQSSQTLILRLKKNDEIYVINSVASDIILGESYSSFSGFLIFPIDGVNAIVGK